MCDKKHSNMNLIKSFREFGPESSIGLIPARNGQPLNLSSLSDPLRDTTVRKNGTNF